MRQLPVEGRIGRSRGHRDDPTGKSTCRVGGPSRTARSLALGLSRKSFGNRLPGRKSRSGGEARRLAISRGNRFRTGNRAIVARCGSGSPTRTGADLQRRARRPAPALTFTAMHPDEEALLQTIFDNPDDDAPRLIYADWLEERGDPVNVARAEFIRVQIELERPKISD